ncbi:hypothetical protein P3T24_006599 [Paraburkholderia sp. GAS33]|uniref:hypothetical protein n=1 Tax=Paraburkholderia sp. GAS33 TaxID=3035130 RepID=UPI003D2151D0
MAEVVNVRTPGVNFDLLRNENVPDFFADGVSNAAIGFPNTRLTFHVLQPPPVGGPLPEPGSVERRKVVFELVIPTAALFELCANIAQGAMSGRQAMSDGATAYRDQFVKLMESFDLAGSRK